MQAKIPIFKIEKLRKDLIAADSFSHRERRNSRSEDRSPLLKLVACDPPSDETPSPQPAVPKKEHMPRDQLDHFGSFFSADTQEESASFTKQQTRPSLPTSFSSLTKDPTF